MAHVKRPSPKGTDYKLENKDGPERDWGAGLFGLSPLPKVLNPNCFPPLYALLPPNALPQAPSWHGAAVPPAIHPFTAEALPLSWKSLHTRIPLFRTQAALIPGPELVGSLCLLLSGTANKDVRTSLSVGKTACSGLTISAAQVHVPG